MRVAIIGTSKRSAYLYAPLVKAMQGVELVGIWGRTQTSVDRLSAQTGVPGYTDIAKLISDHAPQIGIVSVGGGANGEVGLMAIQSGINVLAETPVAHDLAVADSIIREAKSRNLKVEVAEQFHRRPMEQIKLNLIQSGIFGRVYSSFNDFAGHGYHGVSVMRSYLGFDARPLKVVGFVRDYGLKPHYSRTQSTFGKRSEKQEHALVEFEGGRIGVYHWTDVGYDSPLRWWRSSRFLAENGMGLTTGIYPELEEHLTILAPGGEMPHKIMLERRYERVDGGALVSVAASTGQANMPTVVWTNPFITEPQGNNPQWHDDEIAVASCIKSLVSAVESNTEPSYGAAQGRIDQEITLAIRKSSDNGGEPVELPLAV